MPSEEKLVKRNFYKHHVMQNKVNKHFFYGSDILNQNHKYDSCQLPNFWKAIVSGFIIIMIVTDDDLFNNQADAHHQKTLFYLVAVLFNR